MKYSQAKQGRVFVIRLEDGDLIREEIESFAEEKSISCAALTIHGAVDGDNTLVVGPKEGRAEVIRPMKYTLNDPHEITGTGTLFPDENGNIGADLDYLNWCTVQIADAVNEAIKNLEPASLKIAVDEAKGKIAYNYYAPRLYDPRCGVIQAISSEKENKARNKTSIATTMRNKRSRNSSK